METELEAEQDFVDLAYARLDAMRGDANSMLEGVLDLGKGGTFQSRTERDVIVRTSLARLEQLDIGDQALTFGRIDRLSEDGAARTPRPRPSTSGAWPSTAPDHEPLVVDWRAPVAEPFYRATGRDPLGLVLRRHLALQGRTVVSVEDERFASPGQVTDTVDEGEGPPHAADPSGELIVGDLPIGGPAALLAALDRARSGRMTDIVSTIQAEQDEIIRSPLSGVLVVQGGPGTGKTAVALHRAAYLLYTHRFPLERQGVLVVGPNPLFLRYIEQVLPSLGETGVTLSTVSGLVPEIKIRENGPADVARLKGDVRMAKVVARAVRTRQHPLSEDVVVPYGALVLRLTAQDTRTIVEGARRRPGTHNARRRLVEQSVAQVLADRARQTQQRLGVGTPSSVTAFPGYEDPAELDDDEFDFEDFSRKVKRVPELAEALDRMWPRLSPHELLHDLYGATPLIAAASRGILSAEEQALLRAPPVVLVRRRGLDPGGRRPGRRGPPPAGPTGRGRGRGGPQVRAYRGRRGPGPVPHAAAHADPSLPGRLDDRGRGHRPGHRPVGPVLVGRHRGAPAPPPSGAHRRADRQLPDPGRGPGRGQPGPGRGRSRARPRPSRSGAPGWSR